MRIFFSVEKCLSVGTHISWSQSINLLCEAVDRFIFGAIFHARGYFQTDPNDLVGLSFLVSLSFSMLNLFELRDGQNIERFSQIGVSLECLYLFHTKICLQITLWLVSCRNQLIDFQKESMELFLHNKLFPNRLWY